MNKILLMVGVFSIGWLSLRVAPAGAVPAPIVSHQSQDLLPTAAPVDFSIQPDLHLTILRSSMLGNSELETKIAQTPATPPTEQPTKQPEPDLLDTSPTFQRWNREVPNVLESIKRDPAFRSRIRLGLSYFPTTSDSYGWNVGVEDVFVGRTGLTVSGDYQATFNGDRKAGGGELRYYLFPLGSYFNIAPVLGYRYLETPLYTTDGLNVGAKFQAVLSRTGAADIAFTQTWVDPRQREEVGITKFSFGYALTKTLRLSTDVEKQNSRRKNDTRFGISVEWMF